MTTSVKWMFSNLLFFLGHLLIVSEKAPFLGGIGEDAGLGLIIGMVMREWDKLKADAND